MLLCVYVSVARYSERGESERDRDRESTSVSPLANHSCHNKCKITGSNVFHYLWTPLTEVTTASTVLNKY